MAKQNKNTNKLKNKLTKKFRLVVLNEDSFEERFSFKLTRLNVFVLGGVFSVLLIALTVLLIAFTPIKAYIPGFSSTQLKRQASQLFYKVDSLQVQISTLKKFTEAIRPILIGEETTVAMQLPFHGKGLRKPAKYISLYRQRLAQQSTSKGSFAVRQHPPVTLPKRKKPALKTQQRKSRKSHC